MQQVTINIDWNSKDSIKSAEKLKAKLENKGYTLASQSGGLFHSAMVYIKK